MYNVTLRCVRAPLLQWKSRKHYIFWMCICSLRCPACNVHVPYCLCPAPLYNIFPHYLVKGMIFEKKKLLCMKCVFWFSVQLCLKHFSFWEELSEIWLKMCVGLCVKYLLFFSDFNETWILWTDFGKNTQPNFMKICPVGAKLFRAHGQTERPTWWG